MTATIGTENENHVESTKELCNAGGKIDREALYQLYEVAGDDDAPVSVQFKLNKDLQKRLDRYLVDRIPFLSRTSLQALIKEEAVTVNGRIPKASTRLRKGDVITAVLPPPPSKEIPAEPIPLQVIYEDDDLIVINKHDDIIVHPARGNLSGTILNGLVYHFEHHNGGELSQVGQDLTRPGVVHRLDRHTTGVMVAAKSDTAHWRLGKQFEKRQTEKRYLAVVHGRVEPAADVINCPLGKHHTIKHKYAVRWDQTGKESVTLYRVRELYDDFSLVELELKTGRTHQIRVHLSHLGYPIVGDDIYGGRHVTVGDITGPTGCSGYDKYSIPSLSPRQTLQQRQALHAALLGFTHPMTQEKIQFEAPLHDDMTLLIRLLRLYRNPQKVNASGTIIDLAEMLPE